MNILWVSSSTILLVTLTICYSNAEQNIVRVGLSKSYSKTGGDLAQPLTSYYTHLNVGTPPKPFKVLIYTDSRETWLPHSVPFGGIFFKRLHYGIGYSKKGSSSSEKEEREYSFEYQGCKLEGKPYQDVVEFLNVSGSNPKGVSLKQKFLAISSASNDKFSDLAFDGVLSLHPKTKSEADIYSILVGLVGEKVVDNMSFSLWLNPFEGSELGGEITFGGVNTEKYRGDIKYHHTIRLSQKWEVPLQNAILGSQPVSCHPVGCAASFSTGVNDIYGPPGDVEKIMDLLGVTNYKAVDGKRKLNSIDCLRVNDLPTLTFNIDGVGYRVSPRSYVRHKSDGVSCYVAILPGNSDYLWTLGTYFLENYYTVFDPNIGQVGFAERAN